MTAFDQEVDLLFEAAFNGDIARLLSLLDADRSLVWDTKGGLTALHLAAFAGHVEAVDLIVMKGADVNATSPDGSPLCQACLAGHEAVARLLIDYGAQPDGATPSGETPLMAAALTGNEALGRLLIELDADVNKQTVSESAPHRLDVILSEAQNPEGQANRPGAGESALHIAAGAGHAAFVNLLLEHGANPDLRDASGLTALDWAVRNGHPEVAMLLQAQPA